MTINQIHSFLVHPGKRAEQQPEINGARVPLKGKLFTMLEALYGRAETDCNIDIVFRPRADGRQDNECRASLLGYLRDPSLDNGRAIAARLQAVTTNRSGLGLLFVISGRDNRTNRLVLARFPADQGIVAHERAHKLDIEFLERVFMKTAHAYKSVTYKGMSLDGGFWDGRAVDKQIDGPRELSHYWISEFLESELRSTPAAGTKRLAVALRQAIRGSENPEVREELVSAARLMRGLDGRRVSPGTLTEAFGISPIGCQVLRAALPRQDLFTETFQFDAAEFEKHVLYRSVELDNGALLTGVNEAFDTIFHRETAGVADGRVRYSTEGRVVNQQLRQTR